MKFDRRKSTKYVAQGLRGMFVLEKHYGQWWGTYYGETIVFRLPPRMSLKSAKLLCMRNNYWER